MPSQTPQFDKALDEYFKSIRLDRSGGLKKVCRFSSKEFYIRPEDIEFYRKHYVPLPTLEPEERRRLRCATSNSYTLFKRKSSYTRKKIISVYPESSPFKVYEHQIWYSDKWNPMDFGRSYDPERSFFDQWDDLQRAVPHPSLISDPTNVQSDYTNVSKNLKNCYFTFDQNKGEDLYYHQCCNEDRNCIECWALDYSDTCYESKIGDHLFKCFWCEESKQTTESYFLWDCRNSSHCFMSSNLRNKKYYFRNQYIGKEEYEKRIKEINFGSWKELEELKKEFLTLKHDAPRRELNNSNAISSFGDFIRNSKNIYFGLWVWDSENVAYSEGVEDSRDSYDILGGTGNELCYFLANVWAEDNYDCVFSYHIDNCEAVEYSAYCRNCVNCFGCFGLDNKSYCIFNIQYSPKEYWARLDEIKTRMFFAGEYGEFFPPAMLPFPYRSTQVAYYYGFEDYENAKKYGYDTSSVEALSEKVEGEVLDAKDLPDDIRDVKDDILKKVIYDVKNKKHFRYIKQELAFYRMHGIPLPREHPASRMSRWRKELGLIVRYHRRKCARCGKMMETVYGPDSPEKNVWCESCYLKEIG